MDPELPWAPYADTGPGAGTAVHVTRIVPAPREQVFRCWTESALLPCWFRPPGVTSVSAELDVRPGGSYRIAMQRPPEAAETYYQVGTYLEVAPPERLVFTFGWENLPLLEALNEAHELDSRVIVQFRDLGDTTEVSITHERLETERMRAFHRWGWESTLDLLMGIAGPLSEEIYDPVMGYWVSFGREGENLVINTRARPGGGPPPHVHPNGDERFTIQQGEVEFLVGRRKVVATSGDELVVPRGTRHAFKNVGSTEAVFRAVVEPEPSRRGEGFFRETGAAAEQGMYTKRGIPTSLRAALHLLEILERYQDFALISNPPPAVQRPLFPLARRFAR